MLKLSAGFGRGSPAAFEVMTLLASRRRSALKLEQTLARNTRRTDSPAFRAKEALAGVKGDLTIDEFERVVGEALESLPKRFADLVENVVIAVEDEPADDDFVDIDDAADSELLGIYRGVPLTGRTHDMPLLPDEIVVFRGPINRVARTRREAVEQVRETVIHELGHYFGLDDDDMPH
jgi:predicted Zn-dependent protease with MMP-like domain